MRAMLFLLTLLLVLFLPALAFAGASDALPSTEGDPLSNLVKTAIVGGIGWLFTELVSLVRSKRAGRAVINQIDVHQLEQMIAEEAIDYADEQLHKAIKKGAEYAEAISKKAEALGYAEEMAAARKLGKDSVKRLLKIIEARLNAQRREAGAGVARAVRLAPIR